MQLQKYKFLPTAINKYGHFGYYSILVNYDAIKTTNKYDEVMVSF